MSRRRLTLPVLLLALLPACVRAQPAGLKVERDVVYGQPDGQEIKLDWCRPDDDRRLPAVIFVHGGGWARGDKDFYRNPALLLARRGYVCFTINYRLVKDGKNCWPAQLDDAQRAVRWVRAHAEACNLDPAQVGALGFSAGGHLVDLLGTMATRDNSDAELAKYSSRVTCVVSLAGPADFMADPQPTAEGARTAEGVKGFLGGKSREEAPDLYRQASPVSHVDDKSVPFLLVNGADDPTVPPDQSRRMDAALRKAGRDSTLVIVDGEGHGLRDKQHQAHFQRAAAAFFDHWLKGQPLPAAGLWGTP
jgi:acetyl esterase/lipase